MLWTMAGATANPVTGRALDAQAQVYVDALGSRRMTVAPFERGYTQHWWQVAACVRYNVFDLRLPAPMFADYVDALRCFGVDDAVVRAATHPDERYPYPVDAPPRCREEDRP